MFEKYYRFTFQNNITWSIWGELHQNKSLWPLQIVPQAEYPKAVERCVPGVVVLGESLRFSSGGVERGPAGGVPVHVACLAWKHTQSCDLSQLPSGVQPAVTERDRDQGKPIRFLNIKTFDVVSETSSCSIIRFNLGPPEQDFSRWWFYSCLASSHNCVLQRGTCC